MNPENLSNNAKRFFPMIEFDRGEELVWEIRKHPFGLFVIYLIGSIVTLSLVGLLILGPMSYTSDFFGLGIDLGSLKPILILVGFLLSALSLGATLIGAYLYTSDVVLVTSEKIAQFLHQTIFNRKISQLSIGDVQDVTVTQKGIFARIFNYGTLVIETAGEQQNYTFNYTPRPYEAAKAIVGSHEKDVDKHGN
ncbi:MAG: PH domain-containing protein [Patescibacteria group bacterium]